MPRIAAVIVTKNEVAIICKTIESVQQLDGIVLYDMESTDETVNAVVNTSRVPVHVVRGKGPNLYDKGYETFRTASLDEADKLDYDYYVLIDAGELLVGRPEPTDNNDAWYVLQKQIACKDADPVYSYCIRMIKARSGIHYNGPVNECLIGYVNTCRHRDDVYISHDRSETPSSMSKWIDYSNVMARLWTENPTRRNTFIFATIFQYHFGDTENARRFYLKRVLMFDDYDQESFAAAQQLGQIYAVNGNLDEAAAWFLRAFNCSERIKQPRAEPLVCLAQLERHRNNNLLAYAYARLACELDYPNGVVTAINPKCYSHARWETLEAVRPKTMADGSRSDANTWH